MSETGFLEASSVLKGVKQTDGHLPTGRGLQHTKKLASDTSRTGDLLAHLSGPRTAVVSKGLTFLKEF